jgi:hypothetical protein
MADNRLRSMGREVEGGRNESYYLFCLDGVEDLRRRGLRNFSSVINLLSGCRAVVEERKPYPNEAFYCISVVGPLFNVSAVMKARQSKDISVCFTPCLR